MLHNNEMQNAAVNTRAYPNEVMLTGLTFWRIIMDCGRLSIPQATSCKQIFVVILKPSKCNKKMN